MLPDVATVGENIRRIRTFHAMTQVDLAETTGIEQGTISKWETGQQQPGLTSALVLARGLRCSVEELLNGVDPDYDSFRNHLSSAPSFIKGGASEPAPDRTLHAGTVPLYDVVDGCAALLELAHHIQQTALALLGRQAPALGVDPSEFSHDPGAVGGQVDRKRNGGGK